jgi:lysozyme family protein
MSSKNTAVYGIYATPGTAEAAVDHLLARGFTNSSISVLLPDDESTRAFAHEKSTKAPEGTATGATTGGVVGGTLGLLAGIGALAIPGVGPFIAAGPIMATLAGVGVGGAVGGLVGALVGMGLPEYEAKRYEGAVKDGGVLLSVHCDTSEQSTPPSNH